MEAASWDRPFIVSSARIFFESLFSDRPPLCRKLHNIPGSVLVLDEIQALPLKYAEPCMKAVLELVRNYGCSAVLCASLQMELDQYFALDIGTAEICRNDLPYSIHPIRRKLFTGW